MTAKTAHLRPVDGEPAPNAWIAAQALALVTKILAAQPTAIVIMWETANSFGTAAIPQSQALIDGMVRAQMIASED